MMEHKNSPYTGIFRHAPPSSLHHLLLLSHNTKKRLIEQDLSSIIEMNNPKKPRIRVCVDGRLKGGSPFVVPDAGKLSRSLRRSLKESSMGSSSATVQVLTRLACWLILPIVPNEEEVYDAKHVLMMFPPRAGSDVASDDESSYNDSHADDSSVSTVGTHLALDTCLDQEDPDVTGTSPLSVSSLAEAYYAHQAAQDCLDQSGVSASSSSYSDHDADPHRLDYVITQVDIARMARNASRHLDVESILNLPTITYQSQEQSDYESEEGEEEEGMSWTLVPPAESEKPKKIEDDSVCVICLEPFVDGDRLRVLPCNHSFHVGCIDRWLCGSHSFEECYTIGCPTCKKRATTGESDQCSTIPSSSFARIGDVLASQM